MKIIPKPPKRTKEYKPFFPTLNNGQEPKLTTRYTRRYYNNYEGIYFFKKMYSCRLFS